MALDPGAGITGGGKPPDVGAGDQTWVLRQSKQYVLSTAESFLCPLNKAFKDNSFIHSFIYVACVEKYAAVYKWRVWDSLWELVLPSVR